MIELQDTLGVSAIEIQNSLLNDLVPLVTHTKQRQGTQPGTGTH